MGKQITIIGAGVIGLCTAYYLQKEGYEILIIDKGNITDGASFGNAGFISPSHFIPLASPAIVSKSTTLDAECIQSVLCEAQAEQGFDPMGHDILEKCQCADHETQYPPVA